jgi:hypothetical protein
VDNARCRLDARCCVCEELQSEVNETADEIYGGSGDIEEN